MIKGILFDKDGTLMDFHAFWVDIAIEIIPSFLEKNQIPQKKEIKDCILESMGIKDGKILSGGIIAHQTFPQIGKVVCESLKRCGFCLDQEKVSGHLVELFESHAKGSPQKYKPIGDLKTLILKLKERGIYIGLATADTEKSANLSLSYLKIKQEFDFIGADNGIRKPKPDPEMFLEFQTLFHLNPSEILVVGDTFNDMKFAKNGGGISVGVLSGIGTLEELEKEADYTLDSVQQIPELLDYIEEQEDTLWQRFNYNTYIKDMMIG